jgi:endonuclease-3
MMIDWDTTFSLITQALQADGAGLPSVSAIAERRIHDPFAVLVSTVISLRTKDETTMAASKRLLDLAGTAQRMVDLSEQTIAEAIYPAGFYRTKAKNLRAIAATLLESYGGAVPSDRQLLMALPGVGPKTANLTLNLGFGIDAICVDTHVHRISNRLGWVKTDGPEQTEQALEAIMPRRYWIPLNELLVTFGQRICKPVSPLCSKCPLKETCPRVGVTRSR